MKLNELTQKDTTGTVKNGVYIMPAKPEFITDYHRYVEKIYNKIIPEVKQLLDIKHAQITLTPRTSVTDKLTKNQLPVKITLIIMIDEHEVDSEMLSQLMPTVLKQELSKYFNDVQIGDIHQHSMKSTAANKINCSMLVDISFTYTGVEK